MFLGANFAEAKSAMVLIFPPLPGGSSRSGDQPPCEANPLGGTRAGVAVAKRGTVWKSP